MPRLMDRSRFPRHDPTVDPLHLYFWPIIGRLYHLRVDRALDLLGAKRRDRRSRVLEVGYGSGTSFLELIERFDEVHGLEVHDYGPAVAEAFARDGIRVHLTQGSILDPPYADGYFDAVLTISILEHLKPSDQARVMAQVSRLLRPGGTFVVGLPGINTMMGLAFRILGYDINKHHVSRPNQILEAASRVFTIDRILRLPALGPEFCLIYMWFRGHRL